MGRDVLFTFDPFEIAGVDESQVKDPDQVMDDCSDYVIEEMKKYCEGVNSPVGGYGRFKALTKKYKKIKVGKGGNPVADLFLSGEMLDALKEHKRKGTEVTIGIKGKQGDKADGHCNFSGESQLPLRRFIPNSDDEETLKAPILKGIKEIVRDASDE